MKVSTKEGLIINKSQERTYIWTAVTRSFHWLLVICIAATFASAYVESAFLWHISFGIIAGGMLTFRLLWGFMGPHYALFKNFDFSLKDLLFYIGRLFRDKKTYVGHNPAASWATILLIVFGFFCTLSGIILLGTKEDRGIFAFLPPEYSAFAMQMHTISTNVVAIVAIIHMIGALWEHFIHKTDTVTSMIHGYKNVKATPAIITPFQRFFGLGSILISVAIGIFSYMYPQQSWMTLNAHEVVYYEDNYDFMEQCSECHNLFPPSSMTKKMWEAALSDPANHFNEELFDDVPDLKSIKEYILANSAETSQSELAQGVIESTKDSYKYRITKTRYWRDVHKAIPYKVFKDERIESKSNCIACHKNFGQNNYINDEDIQLKYLSNKEALKIYLKLE